MTNNTMTNEEMAELRATIKQQMDDKCLAVDGRKLIVNYSVAFRNNNGSEPTDEHDSGSIELDVDASMSCNEILKKFFDMMKTKETNLYVHYTNHASGLELLDIDWAFGGIGDVALFLRCVQLSNNTPNYVVKKQPSRQWYMAFLEWEGILEVPNVLTKDWMFYYDGYRGGRIKFGGDNLTIMAKNYR